MNQTELLAPAGGLESFFAAIEAGADAVYCGLNDFSARAKAKNFTLAEVAGLTAYSHQHDRKLYVALNTLVKELELPHLVETLAALEEIGIDGVILQDLGVWRLIRDHFPGLALHASTQMTVHNVAGVKMLERMGFERAVLARELSVQEIGVIRQQTSIELEHFIHGALCFGISGQCLFSSYLNGTSGNRGRCAQPCRRRYLYHEQPGYYFSTNDFCAIEFLPQLIKAGVMSFKIEGRMKSAEYVGKVVEAYRLMLDAPPARRKEALAEALELLALSFGRPASKGFLTGKVAADIAVSSQQGSIGRLLGQISSVRREGISFACADRLHLGDRVRILPKNDQAGSGFTVTSLLLGKRKVKVVRGGDFVTIPVAGKHVFRPGDSVYRVSGGGAAALSENACRKKLANVRLPGHGVQVHVSVAEDVFAVSAEVEGVVCRQSYPVETFAAKKSPLSEEALQRVFAKSGGTPFVLELLTAETLPPVVIPPSRLNEIRRDFYQRLLTDHEEAQSLRRRERLVGAKESLLQPVETPAVARPRLSVMVGGMDDLALLDEPDVDELILPLPLTDLQETALPGKKGSLARERLVWDLPLIIYDGEWQEYANVIRRLCKEGYQRFRLHNLGHFGFFDDLSTVKLTAGGRLYTLNSLAGQAWRELGVEGLTLSVEDDQQNMRELLARDFRVPLTVPVFMEVELFQSRIPVRGVKSGDAIHSPSGDAFTVFSHCGLTTLAAARAFSLTGRLREVQMIGGGNWLVDLSRCGSSSPRGKLVLAAVREDRELPGTSLFNFERGLL